MSVKKEMSSNNVYLSGYRKINKQMNIMQVQRKKRFIKGISIWQKLYFEIKKNIKKKINSPENTVENKYGN